MRAAALENPSPKDFMLSKSLAAADETIENAGQIRLSGEQAKFMLDLLDNPSEPNEKMLKAIRFMRKTKVRP